MTLLFRGTVDPGATESVTKFSAIDSLLERWIQAPFRVAAKASSAALPSCPPAAQLLSCLEASWHIRVWQGGAGVRSTATVPWAISAAAPSSAAAPLTAQPPASPAPRVSWVQAACLLSGTKDQAGWSTAGCTSPPRPARTRSWQWNSWSQTCCALGQIAGWHSPSLPPSRAYFSFTSCQPAFSGQRRSWRTFKYKADNDDGAPWRRVLGGAGTVIRVGALCHRWVSDPSQPARYVTPIPQIHPPTVTRWTQSCSN